MIYNDVCKTASATKRLIIMNMTQQDNKSGLPDMGPSPTWRNPAVVIPRHKAPMRCGTPGAGQGGAGGAACKYSNELYSDSLQHVIIACLKSDMFNRPCLAGAVLQTA